MKFALPILAVALALACASPAEARIFGNNDVVVQKTVVRNGRNVDVQRIVVQQQNVHHVPQQIIAVPVQAYAAPVQQFSDCQRNFQSYSQPVVVQRVVVQQQNHCQKFFHR